MEATAKNEQIARAIMNILAENECTVVQASTILRYVSSTITATATVQKVESKLFEAPNPL